MGKVRSVGTTFKMGKSAATTKIGGLTSIGGVEVSADTVDVTTLDSEGGYREFIMGFKDAGDVSLEGFLDDADTGQAAAYAALESGETQKCEIAFTNGSKWTFNGIVTGFSTSASLEDAVSFSATVKVSGKPTFAISGREIKGKQI